jgi:Fe-Mn family superoxide dismutase
MKNQIRELITVIAEAEEHKEKLVQDSLKYEKTALQPVMSKATLDYHFSNLAKKYVERYNKGEGDADFNKAGAVLHNVYFSQFKSPGSSNRPYGASEEFINKHFSNGFSSLKEECEKVAMAIQGSGWVYLARNGQIKTIKNHQIKNDILLLIDWWEHAWALDYQADKAKYLKNIWRIIDWSVINDRLNTAN